MEIYSDVITRYLKMGAGQFLQDFRRDYHLKKSVAHRKSLMSKKERLSLKAGTGNGTGNEKNRNEKSQNL